MVLVKILKRKDASSVLVAVVLAIIVASFLSNVTQDLATNWSVDSPTTIGADWRAQYLQPAVWALLQIVVLEVLGWIYVWIKAALKSK